jgi:hypothetical protein
MIKPKATMSSGRMLWFEEGHRKYSAIDRLSASASVMPIGNNVESILLRAFAYQRID